MPSRFLYLVRHGEADDDGALTPAGQQQARITAQRLSGIRFSAIRHSPLQRAEQTAELIAGFLPGVPLGPSGLLGDYPPPVSGAPEPDTYTSLLSEYSEDEQADGEELAAAAIARYAGLAGAGGDSSELIVTHNFLIGWFVRHALDAPPWRWIGLNQCHAAITIILYRLDRPASLVSYNDVSHLPRRLRWTGFPPGLIPPEPHRSVGA
ncbi:MAG: histidine phosphatase family protein [Actinomycetota bacterium]